MGFELASHRDRARRDPAVALRMLLKEPAARRVRYGHFLLKREGWRADHERGYRLYTEEGLPIRTRSPRRRRACGTRLGPSEADAMNDVWAMDVASDRLSGDRPHSALVNLTPDAFAALLKPARKVA